MVLPNKESSRLLGLLSTPHADHHALQAKSQKRRVRVTRSGVRVTCAFEDFELWQPLLVVFGEAPSVR